MTFPFDPFAELSQIQKTECNNGLSYKDLSVTACDVYRRALGLPTYVLQDADIAPWHGVAGKAAQIIDLPESEQATVEISAKALAKALYSQYTIEKDGVPSWESERAEDKIAWEAVGRHLANLIDSDGVTPNFAELEGRIVEWAKNKLSSPTLVLS